MIISEIQYWKQNKLLPEHYCDFLTTLYSQGNEEVERQAIELKPILASRKKKIHRAVFTLSLLAAIAISSMFIFVNYPTVTLGLTAIVILIFLLATMSSATLKSGLTPFLYIGIAFMLLAASMKLWIVFFEEYTTLLIGLLMLNCALWLFTGKLLKLHYFTISGAAGLLLIIGFLFI